MAGMVVGMTLEEPSLTPGINASLDLKYIKSEEKKGTRSKIGH